MKYLKPLILFLVWGWATVGFAGPIQSNHAVVAKLRAVVPSGGTDPDDISGLAMWLKADTITGVADGATITSGTVWQDQSSADHDLEISGTPTFETNELNGHSSVNFTGSYLANPVSGKELVLTGASTIIVVEKSVSNSGNRTISSVENNRLISNGRDTIQGFVGGTVASGSQNTNYCYSTLIIPASGNCSFYQNGINETTGSITAADWGTVTMGGGFNSEYPVSNVVEVIIYNQAIDSDERAIIDSYMSSRYGFGTFLVNEGFEGTGTPSGWFNSGTDFDYTTSPFSDGGSQSANLISPDYTVYLPGGALNHTEIYAKFRLRVNTLPTTFSSVFNLVEGDYDTAASVTIFSTGVMRISTGGNGGDIADVITTGVDYYVYTKFKAGTGSTGIYEGGYSLTPVRPNSGSKYTSGNSIGTTVAAEQIQLQAANSIDVVIDNIQLSTTAFD